MNRNDVSSAQEAGSLPSASQPSVPGAATADTADQDLRDEIARLTAENRDLRAIPWPREYVLSRASEWARLVREVGGYLQTCRGSCGSDTEGRDHAIAALNQIDALLKAPPSADANSIGSGPFSQEAKIPRDTTAGSAANHEGSGQ